MGEKHDWQTANSIDKITIDAEFFAELPSALKDFLLNRFLEPLLSQGSLDSGLVRPDILVKLPQYLLNHYLQRTFEYEEDKLYKQPQYVKVSDIQEKLALLTKITSPADSGDPRTIVKEPIRSDALTLVNPQRFDRRGPPKFIRGPQPDINVYTGDIRWRPDKGNFFGVIKPIVEVQKESTVAKPIESWTYQEALQVIDAVVKERVNAIFGDYKEWTTDDKIIPLYNAIKLLARTGLGSADKWKMSQKDIKRQLVEKALRGILNATATDSDRKLEGYLTDYLSELLEGYSPQIVTQTSEVGISVVEYDEKGQEKDSFKIFIIKNPNYHPVSSVIRAIRQRSAIKSHQPWVVKVICHSGNKEIYEWGEDLSKRPGGGPIRKPVIYIYPTQTMQVEVGLTLIDAQVVAEYPKRVNGKWIVSALPDGQLIDSSNNKKYPYLFWEGQPEKPYNYDLSHGFCIAGSDTVSFLENKLKPLGLNDREITDFVTYWYPVMKKNTFNIVKFLKQEYTDVAQLNINPKPDTLIRVFMVFKASDQLVTLKEQDLQPIFRNGYTVVEWGGLNMDEEMER
jgi:hypothetical protein